MIDRFRLARAIGTLIWACFVILQLSAGEARASRPVRYLVIGCVTAGKFVSHPYSYQVLKDRTEMDLSTHEGKTIQILGDLTPPNRLFVDVLTVVDPTCRIEMQQWKFLKNEYK